MIRPHGGTLCERYLSGEALDDLAERTPAITLTDGEAIHLANLASGGYSPLTGFMTAAENEAVVEGCTLPSGANWTVPVLLKVEGLGRGELGRCRQLVLRDPHRGPVALLEVEDLFEIDAARQCRAVFGTDSPDHPGVRACMGRSRLCVGGPVRAVRSRLERFRHHRLPAENRAWLAQTGRESATAFSTRNICHLGHEYLHTLALELTDLVGINIITGAQVPGNFQSGVIFDTYEHLIATRYPEGRVFLNNLRLPPIYAGPREAFLQATILQNMGFTHFIVGRDHAGIGHFYPRYGSQEIFRRLTNLAIRILPIAEPHHCTVCRKITTERSCRHGGEQVRPLNGRDVRRLLQERRYDALETILRRELLELMAGLPPESLYIP